MALYVAIRGLNGINAMLTAPSSGASGTFAGGRRAGLPALLRHRDLPLHDRI